MRNYLLAAVAAAALTSPAMARDKSTYVGIDGGVMLVQDTNLDYTITDGAREIRDAVTVDHKIGFDVDLNAGYDFGLVRAEAEVAYKRASIDEVQIDVNRVPSNNPTEPYDTNGKVSVFSLMANVLFDFGDQDGWSGFIGAGGGWARVKYDLDVPGTAFTVNRVLTPNLGIHDSNGSLAFQVLAGIRKSLTPNIDLGLKYRYFNVSKLRFSDDFQGEYSGKYRSHSLLLSLAYNFYTPEVVLPPPPPPPPPPSAASGDADVPGRFGDSGDRRLPAAAAAAAASA